MSWVIMWRRAGARTRQMKCPGCQSQGGMNSKEEPTLVGKGLETCYVAHWEWWLGVPHSSTPLFQSPCLWPTGNTASYSELDVGCLLKPGWWQSSPLVGLQAPWCLLPGRLGGFRKKCSQCDPGHDLLHCKGVHHHLTGFPGGEW